MSDEIEFTDGAVYADMGPITEVQPDPFVLSNELQIAVQAALDGINDRSFSGRNPQLGRMIKCQMCSRRHREHERKCEQVFTYRVHDYEFFREDEKGELVPAYRTAVDPDSKPTMKQVVGAAATKGKRKNPHHNRRTLQFVRLVRKLTPDEYTQEDLETAREMAKELLGLNKTYMEKMSPRKDWPWPTKK